MYQNLFYDYPTKTYYLRDEDEGWQDFKYYPELYKIDPKGTIPTIDGKMCTPVKKYEWNDFSLYEKDVDKLTRVLIDLYSDSDEAPKTQRIVYLDIEIEMGETLTPEYIKSAPKKVTSFALYDVTTGIYHALFLDEEGLMVPVVQDNRRITPFKTEKELLMGFLKLWEEIDATIMTGWNSGYFDVPYLYYRLLSVVGQSNTERLSPIRKFKFTEYDLSQPIEIGGISHLDYMLLFKKFIVKQEPSYKLGEIGEKYVKLGKIDYEGNLDRLFKDDIDKFIEYNIRDVEIIIQLEKKFKFIDLTVTICHLCHVPYEKIYLSTALNDGAILTYLKRKGIISTNKPTTINPLLKEKNSETDGYAGGYLKEPVPGLYEWVIDLDFTSLYPSIIRSLNIGIETLVGRIVNSGKYDNQWTLNELKKMPKDEYITIEQLREDKTTTKAQVPVETIINMIESNDWNVAASGALFRTDKTSVVCEVLTDWFNKRKHYKTLMSQAYKAGNKDEGDYYHRLQHAYKIKLNDVYGCYAINGWRYTDGHKIISSAITLTGQRVTQESIKFVNAWMNDRLSTVGKDYVVTSDTDSLFIQVKDLLEAKGIDLNNKEACIEEVLKIATEIQDIANKNIAELAYDYFNINRDEEQYFELKQEVVVERGYFAAKRRYAMYIVNKEGVPVEEMVMMGLDLMKSNMPPLYKKFGTNLLEEIMFGKPKLEIDKKIVDFKKELDDIGWAVYARPTGVKQIRSYIARRPPPGEIFSELKTKAPINTKAAVFYNDLLRFKKLDKTYPLFVEGDKMRYVSLKPNPFNINVMGFNGNDPEFITEFIEKYVDKEGAFESVLLNKLTGIYDDLGWDFPILNEKINKFFKF